MYQYINPIKPLCPLDFLGVGWGGFWKYVLKSKGDPEDFKSTRRLDSTAATCNQFFPFDVKACGVGFSVIIISVQ